MLLKRTLFAAFIAFSLLASCLNAELGDQAVVDLSNKIKGQIKFTEVKEKENTAYYAGKFTKGINKKNLRKWSIKIGDLYAKSFSELNIEIEGHGTKVFQSFTDLKFEEIIGTQLSVLYNGEMIDYGIINRI
ncbi:16429_t:CDS:1 [Acaulospora colombiana]|uniref:16429_t:CDS:1 n=1 Tax=Acaulospora colombiana TaxID=27376 RepID=A0ACA9KPT5_9GLOM|nr:16429_t:CDS:1 [Acaulospora colombiana]